MIEISQIVEYGIKSKYPDEYSTVDKVGIENFQQGNHVSCIVNRLPCHLDREQPYFSFESQ